MIFIAAKRAKKNFRLNIRGNKFPRRGGGKNSPKKSTAAVERTPLLKENTKVETKTATTKGSKFESFVPGFKDVDKDSATSKRSEKGRGRYHIGVVYKPDHPPPAIIQPLPPQPIFLNTPTPRSLPKRPTPTPFHTPTPAPYHSPPTPSPAPYHPPSPAPPAYAPVHPEPLADKPHFLKSLPPPPPPSPPRHDAHFAAGHADTPFAHPPPRPTPAAPRQPHSLPHRLHPTPTPAVPAAAIGGTHQKFASFAPVTASPLPPPPPAHISHIPGAL